MLEGTVNRAPIKVKIDLYLPISSTINHK